MCQNQQFALRQTDKLGSVQLGQLIKRSIKSDQNLTFRQGSAGKATKMVKIVFGTSKPSAFGNFWGTASDVNPICCLARIKRSKYSEILNPAVGNGRMNDVPQLTETPSLPEKLRRGIYDKGDHLTRLMS